MTSISNRDWLMRLAHEAPDELAAWMGAEHVEAPTLRDLYGILGDGNAPETPISAEIPQKTGEQGQEGDGFADSREKLQADNQEKLDADMRGLLLLFADDLIKAASVNDKTDKHLKVDAWWNAFVRITDRQAAITCAERDRHWMEIVGANANANVELKRQIDELQSELAKRDKGIERLKRQRDEARAQLDRKPTDAVREFVERYEQRISELEDERDGWRMRCGALLDAAHGMQGIADEWDEEVR